MTISYKIFCHFVLQIENKKSFMEKKRDERKLCILLDEKGVGCGLFVMLISKSLILHAF